MKNIIIACLILSVTWVACGDREAYKVQEARIDSLQNVLDQVDKAMEIDTAELKERAAKMNVSMKAIKLYHVDTIPAELAYSLDDYKGIEKIYRFYLSNLKFMRGETKALREQLKTLRKSLVKGKIPAEKFGEYYEIEKKDVENHYAITTELTDKIRRVDSTYLKISPEIEAVSRRITPP
jgi:hypothetical protein